MRFASSQSNLFLRSVITEAANQSSEGSDSTGDWTEIEVFRGQVSGAVVCCSLTGFSLEIRCRLLQPASRKCLLCLTVEPMWFLVLLKVEQIDLYTRLFLCFYMSFHVWRIRWYGLCSSHDTIPDCFTHIFSIFLKKFHLCNPGYKCVCKAHWILFAWSSTGI
jgi:hypothetical protein